MTIMNSSLVFGLVLMLWVTCTGSLPFAQGCDSCGKECQSACGTRAFRICCLNYLKKRSTPVAKQPETELELMMVLPLYSTLKFLVTSTFDQNQMEVFPEDRKQRTAEDSALGKLEPIFLRRVHK